MTRQLTGSPDEEFYAALADEVNDGDPWHLPGGCPDPTTCDGTCSWDPEYVARGAEFAKLNGLSWPPETGDYDRYCELSR